MSDIKLRTLEKDAVERVRQAFSTLRDLATLPANMTLPIGDVTTDVGTYVFELVVRLKSAEHCCADEMQKVEDAALKGTKDYGWKDYGW